MSVNPRLFCFLLILTGSHSCASPSSIIGSRQGTDRHEYFTPPDFRYAWSPLFLTRFDVTWLTLCRYDMDQRSVVEERDIGETRDTRDAWVVSKVGYVTDSSNPGMIEPLTITGTPDTSATSIVNPSSSLLQDLLKEQRASRGSRGSTPVDADPQVPPTPDKFRRRIRSQSHSQSQSQYQDEVASERQRKVNSALSAGLRQPREMGVREMDHVSRESTFSFFLSFSCASTNNRSMCQK